MFTPENPLEHSLMKAATDPVHRPQFLRDFLDAPIFFIQEGTPPPHSQLTTLNPGDQLKIAPITRDGQSFLPIFTSLTRLTAFIPRQVHYIQLRARDFLEITRGAVLVLNPGADYGKEFTPSEIQQLLDGSIFRPAQTFTTTAPAQVLLGQPARYPHDLTNALARLFQSKPEVQAAYLAHFHNPAQHPQPHTLIALAVDGHYDAIAADAGLVASSIPIPDPPLDFIQLTPDGSFHDYFQKTKPFYQRTKKILGLF